MSIFSSAAAPLRLQPIPRVISIGNGKGGVGKTSITANVGGLAAMADLKVLLVDMDPQGSLAADLGYTRDDGSALRSALLDGKPLPVTTNVRPNLDVVKGGQKLEEFQSVLQGGTDGHSGSRGAAERLHRSLSAVAEPYDLILIDTPPGNQLLVEGSFAVSSAVLITTRSDSESLAGVERTAYRFSAARDINPQLALMGVVLFSVGQQSTRILRDTTKALEAMLDGSAPVFQTFIRHLEGGAQDSRKRGKLIHELEGSVTQANRDRFQALKSGVSTVSAFHTSNISGLAEDYEKLAVEIMQRLDELESEESHV